jgi:hypothetical protein
MPERDLALTTDEISILKTIADRPDVDGQRAQAVLAINAGVARADAAAAAGLSAGQVDYFLRRFREQRLSAFETVTQTTAVEPASDGPALQEPSPPLAQEAVESPAAAMPEAPTHDAVAAVAAAAADIHEAVDTTETADPDELRQLVHELNSLVADLQRLVPDAKAGGEAATFSPVGLITLLRDNVQKLTPDMQSGMLQSFQGMTAEDLLDIDTWKGMAYMMSYSARFQAGQVKDKVSGTINEVVPEPIQPGRLWSLGKSGLNRITPEFAKQILSTFEGATPRDLIDPDTWKGLWYMINYSIQFQAEQLKQRLSGTSDTAARSS